MNPNVIWLHVQISQVNGIQPSANNNGQPTSLYLSQSSSRLSFLLFISSILVLWSIFNCSSFILSILFSSSETSSSESYSQSAHIIFTVVNGFTVLTDEWRQYDPKCLQKQTDEKQSLSVTLLNTVMYMSYAA